MSSDIKDRVVIMLVAGLGSRLKPLLPNLKCLTEINNKTIIEHNLESLNSFGFNMLLFSQL